jgi:hypothetical protein
MYVGREVGRAPLLGPMKRIKEWHGIRFGVQYYLATRSWLFFFLTWIVLVYFIFSRGVLATIHFLQ